MAVFANKVTAATNGLGGLLVGLLVVAIGLSLGGPTGYAINPARDLVPRIAHAHPADPRQGRLGLGLRLDPGRRPDDRRRRSPRRCSTCVCLARLDLT